MVAEGRDPTLGPTRAKNGSSGIRVAQTVSWVRLVA